MYETFHLSIAELYDNDSDGCADDPNIMNAILAETKKKGISYTIGVQEEKNGSVSTNLYKLMK